MSKNRRPKFEDWILHEDEDYIVVNKPPGIASLDDRHDPESVKSMAQMYHLDCQLGHRLDKDTSGVLVIAKNPDAYRNFAMQLESRSVEKIYHAVTDGKIETEPILIEAPLSVPRKGKVYPDFRKGKEAATKVRSREIYKKHTLFECKPISGRTHQIRVHLAHIEAPIAGDELYGGKPVMLSSLKRKYHVSKGGEETPLIGRFALHAYSISFTSLEGEALFVEAPYPKDFAVLLKQLEKNRD